MTVYKNRWPSEYIANRIYLAQNLTRQNRLIEAELEIRRTLIESIGLSHKDSAVSGKIIGQLGEILQKQGRLQDAEELIEAGVRIIEASGISADSSLMANARILQGNVFADRQAACCVPPFSNSQQLRHPIDIRTADQKQQEMSLGSSHPPRSLSPRGNGYNARSTHDALAPTNPSLSP